MKKLAFLGVAYVLAGGSTLRAQRAEVTRIASAAILRPMPVALAGAANLASAGRLEELADLLRAELSALPKWAADSLTRREILVSVVTSSPLAPQPMLLTVLVPPEKGRARPVPAAVAGLTDLDHVYLTWERHDDIAQEWLMSREESPLANDVTQLLALTLKGAAVFAEMTARADDPLQVKAVGGPPPQTLYAKVDRIKFPYKRGTLSFTMRTAVRAVDAEQLLQRLHAPDQLVAIATAGSRCAQSVHKALTDMLKARIERRRGVVQHDSLHVALRDAYPQLLTDSACAAASSKLPVDRALAERVLARMIELTSPTPRVAELKGTLRNVPHQVWHVGTVLGVAVLTPLGRNYEREDKQIVSRPIEGLVTSAVVHVHLPRDPDVPISDLGWQRFLRRLSAFGGVTVLPREGLTAGASLALWKGLGIQGSHAWLRANRLPVGVTSDALPSTSTEPLRPKLIGQGRWTFGLSVALQR